MSFPFSAQVVHSSPGRLRLRVRSLDETAPAEIQALLQSLEGITVQQVRFNRAAAAVVLEYLAPGLSPDQVGERVVAKLGPPAAPAPAAPLPINQKEVEARLNALGGGIVGLTAGEVVGGMVGGVAGAAILGPAGAVMGTQMGAFTGSVLGARLGAEAAQIAQAPDLALEHAKETLQRRGAEKVGETMGEVAGAIVGGTALGPLGAAMGAVVGGTIGGQLGEDLTRPPDPAAESKDMVERSREWLASTTETFMGETGSAVVGGAVGRMLLGPTGAEVGHKIGTLFGRQTDWHAQKESKDPKPGVEAPAPTEQPPAQPDT